MLRPLLSPYFFHLGAFLILTAVLNFVERKKIDALLNHYLRIPDRLPLLVIAMVFYYVWSLQLIDNNQSQYSDCIDNSEIYDCVHLIESKNDIYTVRSTLEFNESIDLKKLEVLDKFLFERNTEVLVLVPVSDVERTLQWNGWALTHPIWYLIEGIDPLGIQRVSKPVVNTQLAFVGGTEADRYIRLNGQHFQFDASIPLMSLGVTQEQWIQLEDKHLGLTGLFLSVYGPTIICFGYLAMFLYLLKKTHLFNHVIWPESGMFRNVIFVIRLFLSFLCSVIFHSMWLISSLFLLGVLLDGYANDWSSFFVFSHQIIVYINAFFLGLVVILLPIVDLFLINNTAEFTSRQLLQYYEETFLPSGTDGTKVQPKDITMQDIRLLRMIQDYPQESLFFKQGFRKYRSFVGITDKSLGIEQYTPENDEQSNDSFWPWLDVPFLEEYPEAERPDILRIATRNLEIVSKVYKLKLLGTIEIGSQMSITDYGLELLQYPDRYYMSDVPSWVHRDLADIFDSLVASSISEPFGKMNELLEAVLKYGLRSLGPRSFTDPMWERCYWIWTSQRTEEHFELVVLNGPNPLLDSFKSILLKKLHQEVDDIDSVVSDFYACVVLEVAYPDIKATRTKLKRIYKRLNHWKTTHQVLIVWDDMVETWSENMAPSEERMLFQWWNACWRRQFVDEAMIGALGARIALLFKEVGIESHFEYIQKAAQQQSQLIEINRQMRNEYAHHQQDDFSNDNGKRIHDLHQYHSLLKSLIYSLCNALTAVDKIRMG